MGIWHGTPGIFGLIAAISARNLHALRKSGGLFSLACV